MVISSRFADIFRGNSGKGGLLTAIVDQAVVDQLWAATESDPATPITVDLEARTVSFAEVVAAFEIDDYVRWRLLEGLDDIGITMQSADLIDSFESARPRFTPRTA